ncbi:MAG: hypothetical protein ACRCZD_17085, partial [Phycicoccus sp.]
SMGQHQLVVALRSGDHSGANAGHQTMANGTMLKERGLMMAHAAWERLEQNGLELSRAIDDLRQRIHWAGGDAHLEAAAAGLLGIGSGVGALKLLSLMGPWGWAVGAGLIGGRLLLDPKFRDETAQWFQKQPDRINRLFGGQGPNAQDRALREYGDDAWKFSGGKDFVDGIANGNPKQAFAGGFQLPQTVALGRDLTRLARAPFKQGGSNGGYSTGTPPTSPRPSLGQSTTKVSNPGNARAVHAEWNVPGGTGNVPLKHGGSNGGYSTGTPPVAPPPSLGQSTTRVMNPGNAKAVNAEWNVPGAGPTSPGPKALADLRLKEIPALGGLAPEPVLPPKGPTTVTPDPFPDTIVTPETPPLRPGGPGQTFTVSPNAPIPTSPSSGGPTGPPVTVPINPGGPATPTPPLSFPSEPPSGSGPRPMETPPVPPRSADQPSGAPVSVPDSQPGAVPERQSPGQSGMAATGVPASSVPVADSVPVSPSVPEDQSGTAGQSGTAATGVPASSVPVADSVPVSPSVPVADSVPVSPSVPVDQSGTAPAGAPSSASPVADSPAPVPTVPAVPDGAGHSPTTAPAAPFVDTGMPTAGPVVPPAALAPTTAGMPTPTTPLVTTPSVSPAVTAAAPVSGPGAGVAAAPGPAATTVAPASSGATSATVPAAGAPATTAPAAAARASAPGTTTATPSTG